MLISLNTLPQPDQDWERGVHIFLTILSRLFLSCLKNLKKMCMYIYTYQFSSVAQSCLTPCDPMNCSTSGFLSITSSQNLLKLMSIELVMPSNQLILCRLLLLPPSIFPSIRVFSNESVLLIRWPKYWEFQFQH